MKKSKFLKKSLAMLLALMLVVAMIPLSAAAADQPSLTSLSIGGQTVRINEDGKTFETTVARHSTELTLAVAQNALNYTGDKTGKLEIMNGGSSGIEIPGNKGEQPLEITLSQYGVDTANNGGTLNLRLLNAEGKVVANYQIVLGIHDPSSTASLEESTPTDGTGTYRVEVNNGAETINLVVAEGALKANNAATTNGTSTGAHFRVQTQDNATITAGTNAIVTDMKGGWYEIAVTAKEATITVTSESTNNVSTYKIKSEEVKSLQTFDFGDYEGKWDATHGTITVTIPKEDGKDSMGYNVDFDLPVSFTTYGDTDKVYIAENESDKANATAYQVGDDLDVGELIADTITTDGDGVYTWDGYIWVDCKGYSKLQQYTLVIKLGEDNDTGIVDAYFNGNQASIDGNEITAVLPMRRDEANNQNTDLDAVEVVLYTATSANVKSIAGFTKSTALSTPVNSDIPGYDMWVVSAVNSQTGKRDISVRDKQVVVTAEDGSTQTYVLSATIEQNTTSADLKSIYITDGSYVADGSIQGNTIYFEVPYLTTNVGGWKIYASANSAANVISNRTGNAAVVKNGVATMADLGFGALDAETKLDEQKVPDNDTNNIKHNVISAVNMNDNDYFNDYTIVVNLIDPKTNGTTLEEIEISVQNDDPTKGGPNGANSPDTNEKVTSRVNSSNSIAARAYNETITELGKDVGNTGTIKLTTPYSLRMAATSGNTWRVLTDIETENGGVAFYIRDDGTGQHKYYDGIVLNDLPNNQAAFSGDLIQNYTENPDYTSWVIVVLPEDAARDVLKTTYTNGTYRFNQTEADEGTVYTIEEVVQDPYTYKTVSNLYVNEANLTVKQSTNVNNETTSVGEVSGALPWSYTVSADELKALNTAHDKDAGQFLTFDIQAYAKLVFANDGDLSNYPFYSAGDRDGDGEVDEMNQHNGSGRYENPGLLFVRQSDGTVDLYRWVNNDNGKWTPVTDNQLVSVAENGTSTLTYTFRLTWNPANTTADLKSFSINGVNGTFNGNNVSVYLPYGTDLKGLVPTFTTSEYATVHLDSKTGDPVISGKTSLNFSQTVRLVVVSEDDQKTNPYTVTVTLSDAFSDVPSTAWYYNNVMQAAANGIVNGRGDGTFDPSASVTRRDFAIMLTQMLGISNDGSAVSPFIDVADDDYGVVAIAYCKEHGIISGYEEDGTFRPDATITRQEAASMITKAMGVSEKSSEKYPDDSSIANWAKDAVYMAKAAGLMEGDAGTGNFRPTSTITRAEAASIMVNALEQ